jgi:hypothetical protein
MGPRPEARTLTTRSTLSPSHRQDPASMKCLSVVSSHIGMFLKMGCGERERREY